MLVVNVCLYTTSYNKNIQRKLKYYTVKRVINISIMILILKI